MKTLELKLKKDVLIVDAEGLEITQALIFNKFGNYNLSYYDHICKGSELTEEIASELCHNIGNSLTIIGNAYLDDVNDLYFWEYAIDAFITSVESKDFYWLKNPYKKDVKQWQEAEENTLRNPLIFVKK